MLDRPVKSPVTINCGDIDGKFHDVAGLFSDVSNNNLCGTILVDGPFISFPIESLEKQQTEWTRAARTRILRFWMLNYTNGSGGLKLWQNIYQLS
ncbi:hypothetical protein HanXRQr2_Chr16g0778331 [Helianthus annuus]|nr:hypothetical protein HanXRQr2_Chr16g0778331 [Helianthus annuus]